MLGTTLLSASAGFMIASANAAVIAPRQAVTARATPSFMIVGDSISQGRNGDYTWRYRLWEWFNNNGVAVEFTGPYTGTVPQAIPEPPTPPPLVATTNVDDAPGPVLESGGYAAAITDSGFIASNDLHFAAWGRQMAQGW
jgi:hypothetical protein